MKANKIKGYDDWLNEGDMPEWAQPNNSFANGKSMGPNFPEYTEEGQSMIGFVPGDRVTEINTNISGNIISLGDGCNTIKWRCDIGKIRDTQPQGLQHSDIIDVIVDDTSIIKE